MKHLVKGDSGRIAGKWEISRLPPPLPSSVLTNDLSVSFPLTYEDWKGGGGRARGRRQSRLFECRPPTAGEWRARARADSRNEPFVRPRPRPAAAALQVLERVLNSLSARMISADCQHARAQSASPVSTLPSACLSVRRHPHATSDHRVSPRLTSVRRAAVA